MSNHRIVSPTIAGMLARRAKPRRTACQAQGCCDPALGKFREGGRHPQLLERTAGGRNAVAQEARHLGVLT